MKLLNTFIMMLIFHIIYAQPFPGAKIQVIENGIALKNPWVGGFDLPQFSAMNVNSDDLEDLVVFDSQANKWLIFVQDATKGYVYAPQYEKNFPEVLNMGLIRDYNCDGKGDIFAHTNQGIKVYRNTNQNGNPTFVLEKSILKYEASFGTNNIYKYNNDIAAIDDFDGDGDMDILSFDLLGLTIPYYRNLSIENGFGCDSLIFEENTVCWGNFKEGNFDNSISLNFLCKGNSGEKLTLTKNANRHTGSTLTVLDDDEDGDKDLLLGDIAFNSLTYLKNGGNSLLANMVSYDNQFPVYDDPVNVPIFPAAFYVDVNNDDKKDILVSPNSNTSSVNKDNVWFYENTGNASERFELKQKDFLVNTQIDYGSYSHPVFFDHNSDGLLDLIVCNGFLYNEFGASEGKVVYYENTGTALQPEFTYITDNYAGLSALGFEFCRPTFGDLDNDGDADMIIGEINGVLHYFENIAGASNPCNFTFTSLNYFNIDIGTFSHPQLVDLNEDGLLDLVVGRNAPLGNIAFYKNIGTASQAIFHKDTVNAALGNIHVEVPGFLIGYSSPFVTEKNDINERYIYTGADQGIVSKYLINSDSLTMGSFQLLETNIFDTKVGNRSTITIVDINNDGAVDYFAGNARGGVSFYSDALLDSTLVLSIDKLKSNDFNFHFSPNPAQDYIIISLQENFRGSAECIVTDALGKMVNRKRIDASKSLLTIQNLESGIYFISILYEGKIRTQKLVKY